MSTLEHPFEPIAAGSVAVAAGTSTANTTLLAAASAANANTVKDRVRIGSPASGADCWIAFGTTNAITATVGTDYYVQAGSVEVIRVPVAYNYIATITSSGSTTLYVQRGYGN